jgi:hypothetical protein
VTHPEPDDPDTTARMRIAHHTACNALNVRPGPDGQEAWGWNGRTLGRPVATHHGPAWLRLAAEPNRQSNITFWNGSRDARAAIPHTVPRPRLRQHHDWHEHPWRYRAELYDYVKERPVAPAAVLTTNPALPRPWWTALRTALETVASVPTTRYTTDQQYLNWVMPRFLGFLGTSIDTRVPSWTTAHGDLHWANLCAPQLTVLDWEGWGLAPTGYDAAMLHTYSLLVPGTAARVRTELADVLATPAGRFAELAVIAELLETITHGANLQLRRPLSNRAQQLLGRPLSRILDA